MAAAIFRDSSAGQLARNFLGMKIAPYEDEKEGFTLPQAKAKASTAPSTNASSRAESPDRKIEDESDGDDEKEDTEKDAEKTVAGAENAAPAPQLEDPNIITWSGPNDQDNPQNWSSMKKLVTFGQICLLTFASKCTSIVLIPAYCFTGS